METVNKNQIVRVPHISPENQLLLQLQRERSAWLAARAVVTRSEGFDGQALREQAICMEGLNQLLERLFDRQ